LYNATGMSINKFGIQLVKGDTKRGGAQWCDGAFRNYVRENSLCVEGKVFDAKSRKIRYLASPETDSDTINKLQLNDRFKTINNDMDNRINKNCLLCKNSKREVLSKILNVDISLQNWRKNSNVYIQTKFITLQKQINDLKAVINKDISKTARKIAADNTKLTNQMKQMIDREIKELHNVLKNNIVELYEFIKNEIKTIPKSE